MTFGLSGAALGAIAIGGASIGSAVIGSNAAKNAAKDQTKAANAGIAEQRRQFDTMQEILKPYVDAGGLSINEQLNSLGLNGPGNYQSSIDAVQNSPQFKAMMGQGEEAILQNASATGGLRGGNTQAALATFRPQLLSELLQQRFSNLGAITNVGQASAAGTGQAALATGDNVANLMQQRGAAQAGGQIAAGQAMQSPFNAIGSGLGAYVGLGGKF